MQYFVQNLVGIPLQWCECSSTGLSRNGYPDFEQTRRADQRSNPPSMVNPGYDAADETTHATEHPPLPCGHAALKLCSRTDDRIQNCVCHRPQPVCMSQLDRPGLLYTVRGSVPRPTFGGRGTARPLDTLTMIHSEQTAIDRWDTKRTTCAPCRWRHTTPRDEASCGRMCRNRRTDRVTSASQYRFYPPLPECQPLPSEPPSLASSVGTMKPRKQLRRLEVVNKQPSDDTLQQLRQCRHIRNRSIDLA